MVLGILLIVILFICIAMLWNEGMWGNAITTLSVMFSSMVATNYWEPLADFLTGRLPSFTYLWDFISLWLLFVVTFGITRGLTDLLSRHKLKFKLPVEQVGRVVFAVWAAWLIVCFTTFSLHTAPLAKDCLRGSFRYTAAEKNFFGLGPDRLWLAFTQSRSMGPLSRSDEQGPDGVRKFDPESTFMARYARRREQLEGLEGLRVP